MQSQAITVRDKPALRLTIIALALAGPLFSSCVTGDEDGAENAEAIDCGEHEEADGDEAASARGAALSGHAQLAQDGGFYQRPAVSIKLALMHDGRILQSVATGSHGEFHFTAKLSHDTYRIVVQESLYRGSLTVKVHGQELKDLLIKVQRAEMVP